MEVGLERSANVYSVLSKEYNWTLCSLGVSSSLDILICIVCSEAHEVDLVMFQTIN